MTDERWKQVETLFRQALEREPHERDAYLDGVCVGDEALRREVESLLEHAENAGSFIEKPAIGGTRVLVGRTLGSYRILESIGKGGMGEVWRARDTKLGREVAIKTLPEEFANDEERLTRFEGEARLLASLNHPNIGAIYGLEEEEGNRFLVLELVEGDTLADRLKRGAIPVEESLKLALQIAEALEAAHGKGVIHRDLKPANIKVTPDGKVKVLDFGLAKVLWGEGPNVDLSKLLTISEIPTAEGQIVGTPGYMSPEQVRADRLDKRTDSWTFGCVLFEMLTGRRSFPGNNVTDILAAVISGEPDWTGLPANLHPKVRELLERCLEKEPRDRWHAAGDVRIEIERALADPGGLVVQPVADVVQVASQSKGPWVAAIVLSVVTGFGVWAVLQPAPELPVRLTVAHPGTELVGNDLDTDVAFSTDGRRIVYIAGGTRLYVRALDQLEPTLLAETARSLFLSPDDQWVGFVGEATLMKVAVTGGPAVRIGGAAGSARGATWGPDETIVFATGSNSTGLARISAGGGEAEVLTTPDSEKGEVDHLFPEFLPGGRAVLFTITNNQGIDNSQIAMLDLDAGEYRVLIQGGTHARYTTSGHIVYGVAGTLHAVPFDLDSFEVRGTPVPVLDGVITKSTGGASFSVSPDGTLAYLAGAIGTNNRTLVWVDRTGREERILAEPRGYAYPRISHDGRRVALDVRGAEEDIWVWNFEAETLNRLTFGGDDSYPVWTGDDARIAYVRGPNIFQKASNNTGREELLAEKPGEGRGGGGPSPYFFSPDGAQLIFRDPVHPETRDDIAMLAVDGDSDTDWLLRSEFNERNAVLSPNGRWIAYQSDETGQYEVYVQPFPNVEEGRSQVSNDGGIHPLWSRDGQELFYLEGPERARLITVPVRPDGDFAAGNRQELFEWLYLLSNFDGRTYDVSPDGQRFLAIKTNLVDDDAETPQINIVLNWFQELTERVPVN